jgi:polyhydroxyalkanoate synthase
LNKGWPSSKLLKERAAHLAAELALVEPDSFAAAVDSEINRRAAALIDGLEHYRQHPYRRAEITPSTPIWQDGTTVLLDYGPDGGRPVFIVPSLINRSYIFDLTPERSAIRQLIAAGFRPLLVDWSAPGDIERNFDLTDYIAGRLEQMLDCARDLAGGPVPVIGYCMGGLMAMALALRRQRDVSGLVLLAVPWDFHVPELPYARQIGTAAPMLTAQFAPFGELPTDMLQALLVMPDPDLIIRKFTNFAELDPQSDPAVQFVATEDWLNDGVPLALPVVQECLGGWYGDNRPARGLWRVAGRAIEPSKFSRPSFVVIPGRDRLVPPSSAAKLANQLPDAEIVSPMLGHIASVVGTGARNAVWHPLLRWLQRLR